MVGMTEPTVKPQVLEASGKQEKGLFGGARRCTPRVRRRYQKLHVSRAGATRSRTAARAGATKGCTTGNAAALKPQYPEVLTMSNIPEDRYSGFSKDSHTKREVEAGPRRPRIPTTNTDASTWRRYIASHRPTAEGSQDKEQRKIPSALQER